MNLTLNPAQGCVAATAVGAVLWVAIIAVGYIVSGWVTR